MWNAPNEYENSIDDIFRYALTINGYQYTEDRWNIDCAGLANSRLDEYFRTGKWRGTFEELRCCLFFEQRRYHHFQEYPTGRDLKAIQELYQTIIKLWNDQRDQ